MEKNCNIWSSVAGNQSSHLSLIIFPEKTGPKGSRGAEETAEKQEKLQGGECTLSSLHILAIKRRGLYEQKDVLVLPQTLDRWQGRVKLVNLRPCI